MIFVGNGALLTQAVNYAFKIGIDIDLVCCTLGDSAIPRLKKIDIPILETTNPNVDLLPLLKNHRGNTAFSINNKYILDDELLSTGVNFFNIHGGLVQKYRGIAEICVLAALCKGENKYGVTLHKILQGQEVDSGPVVAQIEFDISSEDTFPVVLKKTLCACQKIFERNIENVISGNYKTINADLFGTAYAYNDVPKICSEADAEAFAKASNLGPYTGFFPKLKALIDSSR